MLPPDFPLPPEAQAYLLGRATEALYRRGELDFKRHAGQKKIKKAVTDSEASRKFFVLCSRRFGKSYDRCLHGAEVCIRQPGARVLYLAPFAKDAAEIASDLMAQLLVDCPKDLQPHYNAQSKEFVWKRVGLPDSILRLRGVNGEHAQYLRGTAAHLIILDECGLMDDLRHVVQDICLPMTMTTGGRIILASTPPRTPGHDSAAMYEELAGIGATVKFTLRDADHIPYDVKVEMLREVGEDPRRIDGILDGTLEPETTTARREFFCEFITDASSAVIPEFSKEAQREIVAESVQPDHFDAYVGMDPGMRDRTGILFGYVDFLTETLVVEDEVLLQRQHASTEGIAKAIKEVETRLWKFQEPYLRVMDRDLRLQEDLRAKYHIKFTGADKRNSIGGINAMRDLVLSRRIKINPRCKHLVRQLENATWNSKASDFENLGEGSIDGHFDLVAALKYLIRHINWKKNPYPANYYARGGPLGPAHNAYVSPRSRKAGKTFYDDTPMGRRLAKSRGHRR